MNKEANISIRVLFKHQNLDLEFLNTVFRVEPNIIQKKGEPVQNSSDGQQANVYTYHAWSFWRKLHKDIRLSEEALLIANQMKYHNEKIFSIINTGGTGEIIIELDGQVNMGDVLPAPTLKIISELGLGLGIEVFP